MVKKIAKYKNDGCVGVYKEWYIIIVMANIEILIKYRSLAS